MFKLRLEIIYELHKKISNNPKYLRTVWEHCNIVKDLSLQIADNLEKHGIKVDRELLATGALIHDIGTYLCFDRNQKLIKPYIQHGILGEKILLENDFPEKLAHFASHHTGVGITKEDIEKQNLPLPKRNFIPETLEEEIVAYCDKFHSKTTPPGYNTYEEVEKEQSKFGKDKIKRLKLFKEKFGIPVLDNRH